MVKQSAKKYRITNSKSDKIFDAVNIVIMILLLFIFVWPLWFVVISSFSNPYEVWTKILPVRDWAAFEKEWSTVNSAANPGEVISVPVNVKK